MSKGKTLLQHYRLLLGDDELKKPLKKKGIMWKVNRIIKKDKEDKAHGC